MKRCKFKLIFSPFIIFVALWGEVHAGDIYILLNKDQQVASLNSAIIESIYCGKDKNWPDGTKIVVTVLDVEPLCSDFLESIVRQTRKQFIRYWRQLLFSGRGMTPLSFKLENELIEFIATNKGAIGFIGRDVNHAGVQVYPIRYLK